DHLGDALILLKEWPLKEGFLSEKSFLQSAFFAKDNEGSDCLYSSEIQWLNDKMEEELLEEIEDIFDDEELEQEEAERGQSHSCRIDNDVSFDEKAPLFDSTEDPFPFFKLIVAFQLEQLAELSLEAIEEAVIITRIVNFSGSETFRQATAIPAFFASKIFDYAFFTDLKTQNLLILVPSSLIGAFESHFGDHFYGLLKQLIWDEIRVIQTSCFDGSEFKNFFRLFQSYGKMSCRLLLPARYSKSAYKYRRIGRHIDRLFQNRSFFLI
ncbi:MAG: hypothetical protein ACM3JI_01435, partial [Anaerolineae bacterium]